MTFNLHCVSKFYLNVHLYVIIQGQIEISHLLTVLLFSGATVHKLCINCKFFWKVTKKACDLYLHDLMHCIAHT